MLSSLSRFFSVSILLACCAVNCFAADGCYVTTGVSEPRIYYIPTTGTTQPRRFFSGSDYYLLNCPTGSSTSRQYAINVGSPVPPVSPNRCYANYIGTGGGLEHSGNYSLNGVPVSFNVTNCPIDSHLPILFFAAGGLAFLTLTRKFSNN